MQPTVLKNSLTTIQSAASATASQSRSDMCGQAVRSVNGMRIAQRAVHQCPVRSTVAPEKFSVVTFFPCSSERT